MDLNERSDPSRAAYCRPELCEQLKVNQNNGTYVSGRPNGPHKRQMAAMLACAYGSASVNASLHALGEQPVAYSTVKLWQQRFLLGNCVAVPLGANCWGSGSQFEGCTIGQLDRQQIAWILIMRALHPKDYLRELSEQFRHTFGRSISANTISSVSRRWGLTHKVVEHVACQKFTPANLAHYGRLQALQRAPFDANYAVVIDEVRTWP